VTSPQPPEPGEHQPYHQQPYLPYGEPYGMAGYPMAPYGVDPLTGSPYSDKTKTTAGLLQLLLPLVGICGVGRLYAGNLGVGLTQLLGSLVSAVLICFVVGMFAYPAFWLWTVIDGIIILVSSDTRDGQGRVLR
jgi:TM2 domain-containing membrane protein YozV